MNNCVNCNGIIRDNDIYCRTCGSEIKSEKHNVFVSILTVISYIALALVILLFVASYLTY